jgi:hypothetical protein
MSQPGSAQPRRLERAQLTVFGPRYPLKFDAVIGTPERIYVAWHRDARGVHELLDANGHTKLGHPPQDKLWEVKTYERMSSGERWGHYREAVA